MMPIKKRTVRRKAKKKVPKGYDSGLEHELHKGIFKDWQFHPPLISYTSPHKYEPDFRRDKDGKTTLIEVKGRFRMRAEATKYIHIRTVLQKNEELVFIFQDASKPMPNAKRRTDGTKQSHGEWATKNKFRYFCLKKGFDICQL